MRRRARFAKLGFVQSRREGIFVIPTDPRITGLADVAVPDEIVIISAASADEDDLRLLDEALRMDLPGSDGWVWDPGDFHEETFSEDFDPATYLVAVDAGGAGYVGLARGGLPGVAAWLG